MADDERSGDDSGSDRSHGFLSDASWTGDVDDRTRMVYASRPKPQWKFLAKWFKSVAHRVSISDSERVDSHGVSIGREMDDLWIDVRVEDGSTSDDSDSTFSLFARGTKDPELRAKKLRGVREGLLLLSVMARVDYTSWIGGMVRRAYFPVPKYLELMHCPEIAREFCFFFNSYLGPHYYQWDLLQHIMGDENFSEAFTQDMEKIAEIAKRDGRDGRLFNAIPVKLAIEPEGTDGEEPEKDLKIVRGVTETVRRMLEINERNHPAVANSTLTRPYFRFDGVELNLRDLTMNPEMFDAIRELLETGVRVMSLIMPRIPPKQQEDVNEGKLRLAWSELMATALGHRALDNGRAVRVDYLKLPGCYMTPNYVIPLCSAVRDTRTLKRLEINFDQFHELPVASQRRIWNWLDYALFSSPPSNSVDTVMIGFVKLRATVHGELASGTVSADRVGDLWRAVTSARDHGVLLSGDRSTVQIAAGATITERGVQGRQPQFETTSSFVGSLVRDQPKKPTVDVLVPGFGFCQVSREHISKCEAVPVASFSVAPITTLTSYISHSIRHDGEGEDLVAMMRTFHNRLLQFVGPSLTALSLGCDLLDGTDIQTIVSLCPKLRMLRLRGVRTESLDAITSSYEAPTNCQITSLDLPHLHVPIEGFENFLRMLIPEDGIHPIQQKLRRLRVGRGYSGLFRGETRRTFLRLLRYNSTLTHFIVFGKVRPIHHRRDWIFGEESDDDVDDDESPNWSLDNFTFNGRLLPGASFQIDRKLAFLSVLHHLREQNHPAGALGTDTIQMIFSYAGDRVWRRAFAERDVDSELLDYMRQEMPQLFE